MRAMVVSLLLLQALPADADEAKEWLDALYARVAADLKAGRPLVVQVHVPLCDNRVLRCGNARIGDGDHADENLYWGTTEGFVGWFGRKGSGWTQVSKRAGDGDVVEERVWRRRVTPGAGWRQRGVTQPFDVYVVATAWRGTSIDAAVKQYLRDLYGDDARKIGVGDVVAGGAAQIVAYVGHNRWMDYDSFTWPAAGAGKPKGTIAVACKSGAYLKEHVPSAQRVPLLLTTDFMFAAAGSFEQGVTTFAAGGSFAEMREAAAQGYAASEEKPLARVRYLFTNPADPRW